MANPAVKKGYVPIANELVTQFALHNIPGNEMRIIWVVLRQTWGWQAKESRRKDWEFIALSTFERMTDMNRKNVCRSIKSLVAKRLLVKSKKGYGFNQNYEQWAVAKRPLGVANVDKVVAKRPPLASGQKATHKRKSSKETITKEITLAAVPAADEIKQVFERFQMTVNPDINYGDTTQRKAAQQMIDKWGFVRVMKMVEAITSHEFLQDQFAPRITTPYQLKKKLPDVGLYFNKKNGSNKKIEPIKGF